MTIKLIVFDLDGVVADTSKIHFDALNKALSDLDPKYCVSVEEDFYFLGTKPTKEKLKILSNIKNLPLSAYQNILDLKRKYTLEILDQLPVASYFTNNTKIIIDQLKKIYPVYLASNTNREFINLILQKIGLEFDNVYCSSDVKNPKPHPEIYLKSIMLAGISPEECLIIEDSTTGQEAAIKSGAHLYPVENPQDLDYNNIINHIKFIKPSKVKWHSNKINVVVPMAGEGLRFKNAGWKTPKPLIDVRGKPMVAAVINDLNIEANYIFIIKEEHDEQYNLTCMLNLIKPGCKIVKVRGKQSGAATTILEAKELINNDNHLLIANSDQMWGWNANAFYNSITQSNIDGSIVVFKDDLRDPRWSFAKINDEGYVVEVAEKNPISDLATGGIYYFTKGSDFVKYAEQMVTANERVNNEFYVAPVYNFAIRDGKQINTFTIDKFWPTGTPEELEYYLANRPIDF